MELIIGIGSLVIAAALLVFGVQLLVHDRSEFDRNHAISGGLSNAIIGKLNDTHICTADEVSRGFTIDTRNGELVPCSQLAKEAIK
ncbi:hypothetical protein ACE02D_14115 [Shewanella bicestrii]